MTFEPSAQNIAWFLAEYRNSHLALQPRYQRNPIWGARQKCNLIESVLLGLPVPEVFVQQTASETGEQLYTVVDGQQRIRTVLQFIGAEADPDEQDANKFVLDRLNPASKWQNKSFDDLSPDEKKRFFGYRFAVRFLNTSSEEEVRDMFERLNRFLSPLKPQEIRNARFQGPFVQLAESLADNAYWAENRIVAPASIRRFGDIEFISELLIGIMHGPQAGSAKVIDDYYTSYEDFEDEFPGQKTAQKVFGENLSAIRAILPEIKETRWSNKTDFYTLFVALAFAQRPVSLTEGGSLAKQLRASLDKLEKEIDLRLANEEARVGKDAVDYVRAVQKGANDKPRRAARHDVIVRVLGKYLKFKTGM